MRKVVILVALVILTVSAIRWDKANSEKVSAFEKVKNSMDFTGKVVLVTGSSSGIGAETVRLFSYLGAQVVVTGRNPTRISQVANDCYHLSPNKLKPLEVVQDLTVEGGPSKLLNLTIEKYDKLDVLVNNAGIGKGGLLISANYSIGFQEVIAINLGVVFQMTQLAVPYLNQTNGTVINLATDVVGNPIRSKSAYSMSKAAVVEFTKAMSLELGPNIRINCISPSIVLDTLILLPYLAAPEAYMEKIRSTTPLGRNQYPIDVAKGIVFLASNLANFVTGSNLKVDGGFYGEYNF